MGFMPPLASQSWQPLGLVLAPSTLTEVFVKPQVAVPIFPSLFAIFDFQSAAFVQVLSSALAAVTMIY